MATEYMRTAKVRVYLNAGNNPTTGRMIVKNTLVGYVVEAADAEKILTLTRALAPCLEHQIIRNERVVFSDIEA